ncbi:MAG: hypothetical protein IJT94_00520 [Oscillibacter sp.]|nr:hypothetical protein [Oscillibacter sp.]
MGENNKTRAWRLYEQGRDYNNRLIPSQYSLVETNTEFFAGNQWLHLPDTPAMRDLPKPTFNILKRVASLFIASLTSSAVSVRVEPLAYYNASGTEDPDRDAAKVAGAELDNLLEKFKFEYRLRDALFAGAQTGDYCAHFWFDPDAAPYGGAFGEARGEIRMELVDGINVLFGNPADRQVENQPWILLVGRDTVDNLRQEAALRRQRSGAGDGDTVPEIYPDGETGDFPSVGRRTELSGEEGKALYVLLYTKGEREVTETGPDGRPRTRRETTVRVTKSTRTAVLYEDVDTGLSLYPVAWGNWEKQRCQYHGRALVTGLIPNQIFINTMFATAMRHLQLMAFPKTVYNADLISDWTGEVGQAIGIRGLLPGQSLSQVAYNLPGAEMSGQIFALIDKAMAYTKECLGATDAQMGNVRPDNTSALMVLQTNSEVPLENIRAGLHEWTEDICAILLDMMGTYYGRRNVIIDREFRELVFSDGADSRTGVPELDPDTGLLRTRTAVRRTALPFDFSVLKRLWLNLRVDVGAAAYFSEIAMTQTLDNLRRDGALDLAQYLERLPDKLLPRKTELLRDLRAKAGENGGTASDGGAGLFPDTGGLDADTGGGKGKPVSWTGTGTNPLDALPGPARKTVERQRRMRADRRGT